MKFEEKEIVGDPKEVKLTVVREIINGNTLSITYQNNAYCRKIDSNTSCLKDLYESIYNILFKKCGLESYSSFDKYADIPFRFINTKNDDDILNDNTLIKDIKNKYFMEEGIEIIVDGGCQNDFNCYLFPSQTFIDLAIKYLQNIKADYLLLSHIKMEINNQIISIYDTVKQVGVKKNYILEITHKKGAQNGQRIEIFIKKLNQEIIKLMVDTNQTVLDIKYLIFKKQGILYQNQTLTLNGTVLDNIKSLNSYKILQQSTLTLYHSM